MKQYLVFAYSNYYPSGGAVDLVGSEDTLDNAQQIAYQKMGELGWMGDNDRIEGAGASILDLETGRRIKWCGKGTEWRREEMWQDVTDDG